MRTTLAAAALALALSPAALADSASGGANCSVITQAAATAVANRIQSDDGNIHQPISVKNLTCLDGFFNGIGLNLITNLLDPATLLRNVEGQICRLVNQTLSSLTGSAQCGLTITGFNLSFGSGLGGGNFCPRLSFGGGGPSWGVLGIGGTPPNGGGGFTVNGAAMTPSGYPMQPSSGSY